MEPTALYIKPFKGLYPKPEFANQVIAPPYDVVTREQAKQHVQGKPYHFLNITRAEATLPDDVDDHDAQVYAKARDNFQALLAQDVMQQDDQDSFYLYQLQQGEHIQTGILARVCLKAYAEKRVRKHELTRPDKVVDRTQHIQSLQTQISPMLLACKQQAQLSDLFTQLTQAPPLLSADDTTGVTHRIWRIADDAAVEQLMGTLNQHDVIYIADGHHRTEAAYQAYNNNPEFDHCLAAIFPENELRILGYHRVVKNLNGETPESFLEKLQADFVIEKQNNLQAPAKAGEITLYLPQQAYRLTLKNPQADTLDVDVLTQRVLTPILGVQDIRQDTNIAFVGGQDAHATIQSHVDAQTWSAGFIMYPTGMRELFRVADAHGIMPPKSTWFEPKLADGLLSYVMV